MNSIVWAMKTTKILISYMLIIAATSLLGACDLFVSAEARLDRAKQYHGSGNHRAAIIELKKVLEEDATNHQARLHLGELYLWFGQLPDAEKELRRAAEYGSKKDDYIISLSEALLAQSKNDEVINEISVLDLQESTKFAVSNIRAESHLNKRDLKAARELFNQSLQSEDFAIDAMVGLAKVELVEGNIKQAEIFISSAMEENSDNLKLHLVDGLVKFLKMDYQSAEQSFSRLLELGGGKMPRILRFSALSALAETQTKRNNREGVAETVKLLTREYPNHPRSSFFAAVIAHEEGKYQEAKESLQNTLNYAPNFVAAQILLGAVNYRLENLEQAETYLNKALQADPQNAEVRKLLAATKMKGKQPEEALSILQSALEQSKDDSALLEIAAKAEMQSGDFSSGLAMLEKSASQSPDNKMLQMDLATAYIGGGDLERAIDSLNKIAVEEKDLFKRDALLVYAYVQNKEFDNAKKQITTMLESMEDDPRVYVLAAAVQTSGGNKDFAQARDYLNKAIALDSKNVPAFMGLGNIDIKEKKLAEARKKFLSALEISPNYVKAMLALANLSNNEGDSKQTIEWLSKAADTNPKLENVKKILLGYLLKNKEYDALEKVAESYIEKDSKDHIAINALADALIAQKESDQAIKVINQALANSPEEWSLHYNLGRAQQAGGNHDAARQAFKGALEIQPENTKCLLALYVLERGQKKFDAALKYANKLKILNPDKPDPLVLYADVLMQQKKYADAKSHYLSASEIAPDNFSIVQKLFLVEKELQGNKAALAVLKSWSKNHPKHAGVWMSLAQFYQQDSQLKLAIEAYEKVIEIAPTNFIALNNLAWLYHQHKDERAIKTAESANELKPDDYAIQDTLGWILINSGQLDRGLELLQSAAVLAPDIPDVQYHIAYGLYKKGDSNKAKNILKKLVDSGVTFAQADEAVQLYERL